MKSSALSFCRIRRRLGPRSDDLLIFPLMIKIKTSLPAAALQNRVKPLAVRRGH
jgi:hypothetical protein